MRISRITLPCYFSSFLVIVLVHLPFIHGRTSSFHPVFVDVKPVNTTWHLRVIRALNISTYNFGHDGGAGRTTRLGVVGPDLAKLIPDAVDIVPQRSIPDMEHRAERGERRRLKTLYNVPVVNENEIFMYGIGAAQELANNLDKVNDALKEQMDQAMELFQETKKLEAIITQSSDMHGEFRRRAAVAEAEKARAEVEIELQRAADEETYLQAQQEVELEQLRRNEKITLDRLAREDEAARQRTEESMKAQFESFQQVEMARINAEEAQSKLQFERDLAVQRATEKLRLETAKTIANAKAEAERANEDVHLRKLKAEAEENRKRNAEAINAIAGHVASSLYSAAKNPRQTFAFISYIALFATGIFTAREIARLCRMLIESFLGKPTLIRETTRKNLLLRIFFGAVELVQNMLGEQTKESFDDAFVDVSLPIDLKGRILSLAHSASKARKNGAPHRHVLFHGPPGTGKTMVARKLAKCMGMEYALMSGGDVGPLGCDAVTQIHNLFRWAHFCRKGVLLFIDEAEAFLGDRSSNAMSEEAHNALNAMLYNTGSERKDFMMILATNRAEDLDSAILDRCDESMLFPLPNYDSRKAQVLHYFDLYVKSMERMVKWENKLMLRLNEMMYGKDTFSVTIENEAMDEKQVEDITKATEGFSGREIAKLMIAIQGNVYASTDGKLTREMITDIVNLKVNDHEMKIRMGINTSQKNKTRHFQSINEFDDKSSGELDTATDSSPTSISPSCSYELSECDLVLEETVHTTGNDQHHQADEANKRGCLCITS